MLPTERDLWKIASVLSGKAMRRWKCLDDVTFNYRGHHLAVYEKDYPWQHLCRATRFRKPDWRGKTHDELLSLVTEAAKLSSLLVLRTFRHTRPSANRRLCCMTGLVFDVDCDIDITSNELCVFVGMYGAWAPTGMRAKHGEFRNGEVDQRRA